MDAIKYNTNYSELNINSWKKPASALNQGIQCFCESLQEMSLNAEVMPLLPTRGQPSCPMLPKLSSAVEAGTIRCLCITSILWLI